MGPTRYITIAATTSSYTLGIININHQLATTSSYTQEIEVLKVRNKLTKFGANPTTFEPPNAGLMKIGWEDDLGPLLSFLPPDLAEEERLRRPLLLPPNAAAAPRRYSGRDCAVGPPPSFLPPDLVEGMALSGHTPTTPTPAPTHAANDADTDASAPPTTLPAARRGEEKGREEKRRCAVEKRKEEKRPRERDT
uniref:Uncharacterized protein n=1 Tax=Oryza barthii TaxID=65489 RepID=A0A0D3HLI3_9ORYZ